MPDPESHLSQACRLIHELPEEELWGPLLALGDRLGVVSDEFLEIEMIESDGKSLHEQNQAAVRLCRKAKARLESFLAIVEAYEAKLQRDFTS